MSSPIAPQAAFCESWFPATPSINLYVRDFGAPDSSTIPVICLHGYWRTSRDFEEIATHLSSNRHVITPDMRGRGRSGRSDDATDYEFERLIDDVDRLLQSRGIEEAVFLGTALGAHIAMCLAVEKPHRVAGFIFNDTAPESPKKSGARMATFSGGDERTFDEALAMIKAQNQETFTRYGEAEFEKMTFRAYWKAPSGMYVRDFDQRTNLDFPRAGALHPDFWPEFRKITVPIALLRGENSDYVTAELAQRMVAENANTKVYTIPGCGHPPMLWEPESLAAVDEFLATLDR